jgi:hypothetical protein
MNREITKAEEIKALRALVKMDGYFAEYFKPSLEKMCENIKKDYPIELDTEFNRKAEDLQVEIEKLKGEQENDTIEVCCVLLRAHQLGGNEELYNYAVGKMGRKRVISYRHNLGLYLSKEEIDFLINE